MILDASLSPDARAIVEALYAVRDAITGHSAALERIAKALETEREWFDHAPANDAVDEVILSALSAAPMSIGALSNHLYANFCSVPNGVFDGNRPALQARLLALEVAGKVESPDGHGWALVEAAR